MNTKTLVDFLLAPKPDWMIPADVSVMMQMIVLDGQPYRSEVVAPRAGMGIGTLRRSISKLEAAGWITFDYDTRAYSVHPNKLPKPAKETKE